MGTVQRMRMTVLTEVDSQEEEVGETEAPGVKVRMPDVAGPDQKARRNFSERNLR